jgi:hypothetical protein
VPAPRDGVSDFGDTKLRGRPVALLRLGALRDSNHVGGPAVVWVSAVHGDRLLGRETPSLVPRAGVSYDGWWMHLPPVNVPDPRSPALPSVPVWEAGESTVYVARVTSGGLLSEHSRWGVRPDEVAELRPRHDERRTWLEVPAPRSARGHGQVTLYQRETRPLHTFGGTDAAPVDPFRSVAVGRTFTLSVDARRSAHTSLAPGLWKLDYVPTADQGGRVGVSETESTRGAAATQHDTAASRTGRVVWD